MAEHAHSHAGAGGHSHDEHEHHVVSPSTYLKVFAGLMVLLVVTLAAAAFDLGALNLPIAMAIAIAKVYLIMAFFMHLKFSSTLVRLFALIALAFLLVMFVITMSDYLTRHWLQA
jgi:cytochrome c oxidase subunit 4